jgi:hypothetical protein
MGKGPGSAYDKWNLFVVISDTDIPDKMASELRVCHLRYDVQFDDNMYLNDGYTVV